MRTHACLGLLLLMIDVAAVDVRCFQYGLMSLSMFGMDIVIIDDGCQC